jgi:hypothetical protein
VRESNLKRARSTGRRGLRIAVVLGFGAALLGVAPASASAAQVMKAPTSKAASSPQMRTLGTVWI